MSDSELVDGERYIKPELSNVLFCLMKDHENDNTNLRDGLIAECITTDNLSMSPASGFSINAHDESDLHQMLNDISSPDDTLGLLATVGQRAGRANLREELYKQKLMRG